MSGKKVYLHRVNGRFAGQVVQRGDGYYALVVEADGVVRSNGPFGTTEEAVRDCKHRAADPAGQDE